MRVIEPYRPGDRVNGDAYGYGGPRYMAAASAALDLAPLEPPDAWLASLPYRYVRRGIRLALLSEARVDPDRRFVKQPREKDLPAGTYTGADLPASLGPGDPTLLVSEIVSFVREYRLLVLDGHVRAASRYLSGGTLDVRPLDQDPDEVEVLAFADALLVETAQTLPSAVTIDIGWAVHADRDDDGLAVVEANMAWFSNIYACDPESALDVVMRAAGPTAAVGNRDRPFITASPRQGRSDE